MTTKKKKPIKPEKIKVINMLVGFSSLKKAEEHARRIVVGHGKKRERVVIFSVPNTDIIEAPRAAKYHYVVFSEFLWNALGPNCWGFRK